MTFLEAFLYVYLFGGAFTVFGVLLYVVLEGEAIDD